MANYKLAQKAKEDLARIYRRGIRKFGEGQADSYYQAFFTRFERISEQPFLYPSCYFPNHRSTNPSFQPNSDRTTSTHL